MLKKSLFDNSSYVYPYNEKEVYESGIRCSDKIIKHKSLSDRLFILSGISHNNIFPLKSA